MPPSSPPPSMGWALWGWGVAVLVAAVALTLVSIPAATAQTSTSSGPAAPTSGCGEVPNAAFTPSARRVFVGQGVTFHDESTPPTLREWNWDFGDGARSSEASPTHTFVSPGPFEVHLTVSGGGSCPYSTTHVLVTVEPRGNEQDRSSGGAILAPTPFAGPDQNVVEGSLVHLHGIATDDEAPDITYDWRLAEGPPGFILPNATGPDLNFTAPQLPDAGVPLYLTFELRTGRAGAQSAPDALVVTITTLKHAPVANAGPMTEARRGATVRLDASSSSDLDGDALTFTWIQTEGPPVVLSAPNTGSPSFVVPPGPGVESADFQVTVTDGRWNASDQVRVWLIPAGVRTGFTVKAQPDPDAFAFEPEPGAALYVWEFGDGSNATAVRPVHIYQEPGLYAVRLTVEDQVGLRTEYVQNVTVRAHPGSAAVVRRDAAAAWLMPAELGAAALVVLGATFLLGRKRR